MFLTKLIKMFTKKSGRKMVKFTTIVVLCLIALIIFWWIWSYFTVGFMIEEGVFDDVAPQRGYNDGSGSGNSFSNDYDALASKISRIDFDALPDDIMVSELLGTQYYIPEGYTAEMYLKLHLLFAEICGNHNADLGGEVKVQPYMLYGVWMHENEMQIPNKQDPFEAWLTLKAKEPTDFGYAGSFGQVMLTFAEAPNEVDYGVYNVTSQIQQVPKQDGAGTPVLFISSVEAAELSDEERLLTFVTNHDTSSFEDKIKYKQHFVGWSGPGVQRPSSFFLPDIAASVAINASQNFSGRSTYNGVVDNSYYLTEPKSRFSAGTPEREYTEVAAFFCSRAGRTELLLSESNDVILDVIPYLLETGQMDYFISDEFILECETANRAYDTGLAAFADRLYGRNGKTAMLSPEIIAKIESAVGPVQGGLNEFTKAPIDAVYVISAGKFVMKSIDALADAVLANPEYVLPEEGDSSDGVGVVLGDRYPDGIGQNAKDRVDNSTGARIPDGLCDTCGGSVFEEPKEEGCHKVSVKIVLPLSNPSYSNLNDFHKGGVASCPGKVHYNGNGTVFGHEAYDLTADDWTLRACVDGYVLPVEDTGAGLDGMLGGSYGYHTYLAYPNKDTPTLFFSYAHMVRGSCSVGGKNVLAGTVIGTGGQTGYSTGRHLHFQVSNQPSASPGVSIDWVRPNPSFSIGRVVNGQLQYSPYVIVDHKEIR